MMIIKAREEGNKEGWCIKNNMTLRCHIKGAIIWASGISNKHVDVSLRMW